MSNILKKGDLIMIEKSGSPVNTSFNNPAKWIDKERGVAIVLKVYEDGPTGVMHAELYWQKGRMVSKEFNMDKGQWNIVRDHKDRCALIFLWKMVGRSGSQWDLVPCGANGELSDESVIQISM